MVFQANHDKVQLEMEIRRLKVCLLIKMFLTKCFYWRISNIKVNFWNSTGISLQPLVNLLLFCSVFFLVPLHPFSSSNECEGVRSSIRILDEISEVPQGSDLVPLVNRISVVFFRWIQ